MRGGTQWWLDLTRRRSSQRSHINEVFREARQVGGRLTTLAVYEFWGDLLFEAYEPAKQHTHSLYVPMTTLVEALSEVCVLTRTIQISCLAPFCCFGVCLSD